MTVSHSKKPAKNRSNKPRRRPIPKSIRERCLAEMQRLRRIEESNDEGYVRCISCGNVMHWKEAQGGRYIPRTVRATELEKDNIWPQCPQCNGVRAGNLIPYRYNLARRIGEERVKRLENMRAAYYGDEEALAALSTDDQRVCIESRKRGKVWYAERFKDIHQELAINEKRFD